MSVKILKLARISLPALRLIGKRYSCSDDFAARWAEWWRNHWFDALESLGAAAVNDDACYAAKRIHNGGLEYWIGMLFAPDREAPAGYEAVDIGPSDYALFWLYGSERSGELTSFETHTMCLGELAGSGFQRREDDWCFEKYQCPRFTTPDEAGNVILDYAVAVERPVS